MRDYLNAQPDGTVIAGVTAFSVLGWLPTVTEPLSLYGANVSRLGNVDKYVFLGIKGWPAQSVYEQEDWYLCGTGCTLQKTWTLGVYPHLL